VGQSLRLWTPWFFIMSKQLSERGTGPGGVGRTNGKSNLILWLKADADVSLKGDKVSQWNDQSGYGNYAVQLTATAQPTYIARNPALNNQPCLHFNGRTEFLRVNHRDSLNLSEALTAFVVIKCTDLQQNNGLFSKSKSCEPYSNYALSIEGGKRRLLFEHAQQKWTQFASFGTIGNKAVLITFSFDSHTRHGHFGLNGQLMGDFTDSQKLTPNDHILEIGVHNRCALSGDWLNGDLAELVLFRGTLNSAQRVLVENYLCAKYGLPIASTPSGKDVYFGDTAEQGGYAVAVAGIGKENDGLQPEAYSGGLTVLDRTFLQHSGDYLLVGHKSSRNNLLDEDLPTAVTHRWERVWYFSISSGGNQEGKITLIFDNTACATPPPAESDYVLLERLTEHGEFTVVTQGEVSSEGHVTFNLEVSDLISGRYYTLGLVRPVSIMDKFTDLVRDWWQPKGSPVKRQPVAPPRVTTAEQKVIKLVERNLPLLDKGNALTADEVRGALVTMFNLIQAELPRDILAKVESIQQSILHTLPYIADVGSSNQTVYMVRQMALSYLPETLENYLKLPRDFALHEPIKDGKTARQLLLEQLDLLDHEMAEVVREFHRNDAEKLLIHGRFLEQKFTRGDSLLD